MGFLHDLCLKSLAHPVSFTLTHLAQYGPYSKPQQLVVDERCWMNGTYLSSGPVEPALGLGGGSSGPPEAAPLCCLVGTVKVQ